MSKFIKLKQNNGNRVLVNVAVINSVHEQDGGSQIETPDGTLYVKESYQTVVNRLTKGDAEPAAAE